jgi:hypothetical protein
MAARGHEYKHEQSEHGDDYRKQQIVVKTERLAASEVEMLLRGRG